MANDDKKEYKDMLVLLSYMGSGPSILNKLDQLSVKMEDPALRDATTKLAKFFHDMPEIAHVKKFRLLSFAQNYSMNAGDRKRVSDSIYRIQHYCQKCVDSQEPQWQMIARAHGWTPPATANTPT